MDSPLSGSLAKTMYKAMKSLFLDAVLTREIVLPTSPAFDPADPPAPTRVNYPCKAVRDSYSTFDKSNTSILTGDSKILILVNSLSIVPDGDDIITIQGNSFSIITVDVDPANAVWVCQGRL